MNFNYDQNRFTDDNKNFSNKIIIDNDYYDPIENDQDVELITIHINEKENQILWIASCNLHYTIGKHNALMNPIGYQLHICRYFKSGNLESCQKKHLCPFAHFKNNYL